MKRFPILWVMAATLLLASALARAEDIPTSSIEPHRPNYIIYTHNFHPTAESLAGKEVEPNELKFQFSFKYPVWNSKNGHWGVYGAYTQLSLWQIFAESAPFRETNYEPEGYVVYRPLVENQVVSLEELRFGINHQSNGRDGEASRSWNRFVLEGIFKAGPVQVNLRPWWRWPENDDEDDNPHMEKYLGYGDLRLAAPAGIFNFSLLLRNNLRHENRGAVEAGVSCPLPLPWPFKNKGALRFYAQYFEGYGESLIDYDRPVSRIGAGFILSEDNRWKANVEATGGMR